MATVRIVREYPHPPKKVWRALTDPTLIALWGMRPEGFSTAPGAKFRFVGEPNPYWRGYVDCEMREAKEPVRLRYAWVGDDGGEVTEVTFELEPTATGTRVTFTHDGFGPESEAVAIEIMKPGWEKTFDVEWPLVFAAQDDDGALRPGSDLKPKFPA